MYRKDDKVNIPYGDNKTGYIVRKQGFYGYQVKYLNTYTTQDFKTSKLSQHTGYVTNFVKTSVLDALNS